jgi:hypothetical protein
VTKLTPQKEKREQVQPEFPAAIKESPKSKRGGGRPSDYTEDMCGLVATSIEDGATWDAIAKACGCAVSTAKRWAAEHEEFSDAVKTAKGICDDLVERSLFRKATGYTMKQQTFDKRTGKIKSVEINVPADTIACIFFLKNRRPADWRDKHEITGVDGGPIQPVAMVPTAQLIAEAAALLKRAVPGQESEG